MEFVLVQLLLNKTTKKQIMTVISFARAGQAHSLQPLNLSRCTPPPRNGLQHHSDPEGKIVDYEHVGKITKLKKANSELKWTSW